MHSSFPPLLSDVLGVCLLDVNNSLMELMELQGLDDLEVSRAGSLVQDPRSRNWTPHPDTGSTSHPGRAVRVPHHRSVTLTGPSLKIRCRPCNLQLQQQISAISARLDRTPVQLMTAEGLDPSWQICHQPPQP